MIPENATEKITEKWDDGTKRLAYYYINGQKVGYRYWDEDGLLSMEYEMKGDLMHGAFRTWQDGKLLEESFYFDGKEHGAAKQYDYDGTLIGSYKMEHGTGVDLWFCSKGVLAEERYYQDGQRHGYERWWNGDNATLHQESHFNQDKEHGIFREWNAQGRLRRGFPQYFVNGVKVTKRQYIKACQQDASLPKYVEKDDQPNRIFPEELIAQNAE